MMDLNDKYYFLELLIKAYEGTINAEEIRHLNHYLGVDDEAVCLYAEFFDTLSGVIDLSDLPLPLTEQDDTANLDSWFTFLAHDEKTAPALEMPEQEPEKTVIRKVVYPKPPRRVNKLSIFSGIVSLAALMMLALFIRFAPNRAGYEVATIADSYNAQWADTKTAMKAGTRVCADRTRWLLREGLVEFEFDTHAHIVVEGPAEFQILAEDRIDLLYGKVYTKVPPEAIGFTVNAPSARIIDLGTEFGVEADTRGNTYLHMIKGKATLIAGDKNGKTTMDVGKGSAKKVSGDTQAVTDIPCRDNYFVRMFDSARNTIWRQQPTLDLADMAGKGNGLGTGQTCLIINPQTGYTHASNLAFLKPRGYLPMTDNRFLDGIFVPDGDPVLTVSSQGHTMAPAPQTSGLFSIDLVVNPTLTFYEVGSRSGAMEFDGQIYGAGHKPCITMHANIGLTFDLEAIRNAHGCRIERFTTRVGIADLNEPYPCNADFWVLVDGEVRYSLRQLNQKGMLKDISVDLAPSDRFLTLMTTDGEDVDNPQGTCYQRANSCDWGVYAEPMLVLK